MEHSVTYTVEDGTEYRLTYDNETGDGQQMHYLLHEDGVLKLECTHHLLPGDLTEEEFKSVIVPAAFFNCLSKNISIRQQKEMIEATQDRHIQRLAVLLTPHVKLTPEAEAWLDTVIDRRHNVEIMVQLVLDAEVERFSNTLNAEPVKVEEDEEDYVRPAVTKASKFRQFVATYWPAIIWSAFVVGGVATYLLVV